jgi:GT2 family glycosyltransferase
MGDGRDSGATIRISVVVPSYARPEALRRCLESLLVASRVPPVVVVVCRPEDEATRQVVRELRAQAPEDTELREALVERPGQPAALNAGLQVAPGEVVAFLDDDVVVRPEWCERLLQRFADRDVGGVGGRDVIYEAGEAATTPEAQAVGQVTWYGRLIGNHHCPVPFTEPVEVAHLKGCNMAFRREYLGRFDEAFVGIPCLNDTDISLTARERGARLLYDPGLVVEHHVQPRAEAGGREALRAENVFAYSHNYTYCMCKHLSGLRRWSWGVYTRLVGQGHAYGLLKLLRGCLGDPRLAWRTYRVAASGRRAGAETWQRAQAGAGPKADEAAARQLERLRPG